jgi:hypothetical protein
MKSLVKNCYYRCCGMMNYRYRCDTMNYRYYSDLTTSHCYDMQVGSHDHLTVVMVVHFLLYPQGEMRQDCDQQPYLDGCDERPYYLYLRDVVGDCDAEVCEVDGGDDGANDSGDNNMDGPNTSSNYNDMVYSNSRTDHSNHNTNHTKAQPLLPKSQTSRLCI